MKRIVAIFLMLAMLLAISGCEKKKEPAEPQTEYDGFYVDGTTLYDANGEPFVMRGICIAHAWFKGFTADSIKISAEYGCNALRISIAEGSQYEEDVEETVTEIIDTCKQNKVIPILTVHDETGSSRIEDLENAVDYWIKIKNALIGNEKYVIVNIANEWVGKSGESGSERWKEGYVDAVKKLRDAGIKNTLIIDAAGWGQYPGSIVEYGKDVLAADKFGNTMFGIHMYETAGRSVKTVQTNINNVRKQGLCVCIGEFGGEHKGKDVKEEEIMRYCRELGVGWTAWSYFGNNISTANLDLFEDWEGKKLSEDWGEEVFNGENGIKSTSVICSVYDDDYKHEKYTTTSYSGTTTSSTTTVTTTTAD